MHDLAPPPRFDLVVGVDLTEMSETVLHHAFEHVVGRDATLHVVAVLPERRGGWRRARRASLGDDGCTLRHQLGDRVTRCLEEAVADDVRAGWMVRLHVARGRLDEVVGELAADVDASLVVVGRSGASTDRLVERSACAVLVVAPPRDAVVRSPSCGDCADVRGWSKGERWFCTRHHGEWIGHAALLALR
jgi:hypothetical protein